MLRGKFTKSFQNVKFAFSLARLLTVFSDSRVSMASVTSGEDHQHDGFHASTQPYCRNTKPRILTHDHLLKEYKCMVEGCGQTG
jgi:hypothetical protein